VRGRAHIVGGSRGSIDVVCSAATRVGNEVLNIAVFPVGTGVAAGAARALLRVTAKALGGRTGSKPRSFRGHSTKKPSCNRSSCPSSNFNLPWRCPRLGGTLYTCICSRPCAPRRRRWSHPDCSRISWRSRRRCQGYRIRIGTHGTWSSSPEQGEGPLSSIQVPRRSSRYTHPPMLPGTSKHLRFYVRLFQRWLPSTRLRYKHHNHPQHSQA